MASAARSYQPGDIRNVVLLGHGGAGKTTLAEAMLHRCGMISRMGTVEEGSTASDFEVEAKGHRFSTGSTVLFATREGREINFIDTPGHGEFVGQALAALPAVETAVIVVNAEMGIEEGTRRLFAAAGEMGLARMFVINKIDRVEAGALIELVVAMRETFGGELHCVNLPKDYGRAVLDCFEQDGGRSDFGEEWGGVKGIHREMVESVVEIDEGEMEKYLAGEEIAVGELRSCFMKSMNGGKVVPILFAAAKTEVGVDDLLHLLVNDVPSPMMGKGKRLRKGAEVVEVGCEVEGKMLGQVFKVTMDASGGKLAMVRILRGKMDAGTMFVCGEEKKVHKVGHVLKVEGREHPEMNAVFCAGDIVGLAKVEDMHVNQILHEVGEEGVWGAVLPVFPEAGFAMGIVARNSGEEVKISGALSKLGEEDPTFGHTYDVGTHEIVIHGMGETHLRVMVEKLKNRFHLEVTVRGVREVVGSGK